MSPTLPPLTPLIETLKETMRALAKANADAGAAQQALDAAKTRMRLAQEAYWAAAADLDSAIRDQAGIPKDVVLT